MREKNEKKKINIYEVAGKTGAAVKKYGGIILTTTLSVVLTKGIDVIRKKK